MNYNKAKKKWFKENITEFCISCNWYDWSYTILHYIHGQIKVLDTQALPEEVKIIQQYLSSFKPFELFCEARRLQLVKASVNIVYNTKEDVEKGLISYLHYNSNDTYTNYSDEDMIEKEIYDDYTC